MAHFVDRIKNNKPIAATLLRSFAFLYSDNIPLKLFEKHSKNILELDKPLACRTLNTAINYLGSFSLVRRTILETADNEDPAKDTLTIHRLVQIVILLDIELEEKLQYCRRIITVLHQEVHPQLQSSNNEQHNLELYVPHIRHVAL